MFVEWDNRIININSVTMVERLFHPNHPTKANPTEDNWVGEILVTLPGEAEKCRIYWVDGTQEHVQTCVNDRYDKIYKRLNAGWGIWF